MLEAFNPFRVLLRIIGFFLILLPARDLSVTARLAESRCLGVKFAR